MRYGRFFVLATLALFLTGAGNGQVISPGAKRRAEILDSSVKIFASFENKDPDNIEFFQRIGSGTIIWSGPDSYILTASHVIRLKGGAYLEGTVIEVQQPKEKDWLKAKFVGMDTERDLAVIKVHAVLKSAAVFAGEDAQPLIADDIYVAGYPDGRKLAIMRGMLTQSNGPKEGLDLTAPVYPGMSGGGVFWLDSDDQYKLIGVAWGYTLYDVQGKLSSKDPYEEDHKFTVRLPLLSRATGLQDIRTFLSELDW